MKLSVIIVNYNVVHFLELCLHSVLRATKDLETEIIVVDNQSMDGSIAMLEQKFPEVTLLANQENLGFSKANNQAVRVATGDYILFLNPDTVMPEDFFQKILPYMDSHPEAGAIGPRLIDGRGVFAPDSKKSFPTLSVALFKTMGLGRLFPKSSYFNKYYAVHVPAERTAEVEVLSGCCMLVRRSVLAMAGNGFDEDYFMYCEDVDLCYRIREAGFKNIYFPETSLIHYKGESTRKASLSYVRIFNEALVTFVKKHYSKSRAQTFLLFIKLGILLRAILGVGRNIFRLVRLPLFDILVLFGTLFLFKNFWVGQVRDQQPLPASFVLATFPAYVFLWVISLYLNGAYDQPYRPLRVVRGMMVGTVFILAYFGLLPAHLRYSRALIILSGVSGTVILLGLHEFLGRLGIFKFIRRDDTTSKAVIVSDISCFYPAMQALNRISGSPEVAGRISIQQDGQPALASLDELQPILFTAGINEVIFCINGLSYARTLELMQECGPGYEYKIHIPGTETFIGSSSSETPGIVYSGGRKFKLGSFAQMRNKRMVDIVVSLMILLGWPLLLFILKRAGGVFINALQVLAGKKTWVGYHSGNSTGLPALRPSVLPVHNILPGYIPPKALQERAELDYALNYVPGRDLVAIWRNKKYLGN